jgi:hypothetical protein
VVIGSDITSRNLSLDEIWMRSGLVLVTLLAGIALGGCVETADFAGSGGSSGGLGGSGGSSQAGERLARQVCSAAVRDSGAQIVDVYKSQSVDFPFNGAGIDLYFNTRRNPMTVSLSCTRCRFMYDTGRATLTPMKRP